MRRKGRDGMLYKKGTMWGAKYRDADGNWKWVSSGFRLDKRREAQVFLEGLLETVAEQRRSGARPEGILTIARFADRWLGERREREVESVVDDQSRMRNYVIPTIGSVPLADVRPSDIRSVMQPLMAKAWPSPALHLPLGT